MEITKSLFRKLIIAYFLSLVVAVLSYEYLYQYELDDVLFKGYLYHFLDEITALVLLLVVFILGIVSLILIYFFKGIGRSLYLFSLISEYIIIMFMADEISISILLPLEGVTTFLEIFILYLIYLTPLKLEFVKYKN
jgi:hypothetical protein